MVHVVGVLYKDTIVETELRASLIYASDFLTALQKVQAWESSVSVLDVLSAVFGNPVEVEALAIYRTWMVSSDTDNPIFQKGRPGSWIISLRQVLDIKYHVLTADFARAYPPPYDVFFLNAKPLNQSKTRRRVTVLKHHRYDYPINPQKKAP